MTTTSRREKKKGAPAPLLSRRRKMKKYQLLDPTTLSRSFRVNCTMATSVEFNSIRALLTLPASPSQAPRGPSPAPAVAILTHGASGDATAGRLPLYASMLAARGVGCLRVTARSSSLAVRAAALSAAVDYAAAELGAERIALGGHSMGARAACLAAAERMTDEKKEKKEETKKTSPPPRLAAVFLSSFPLHPPGKGETGPFRDEVLLDLFRVKKQQEEEKVVVVVARGSRDAFSTDEPWRNLRSRIDALSCSSPSSPCSSRLEVVDVIGGDHGLKCSAASGGEEAAEEAIGRAVSALAEALLGKGGGGGGGGGGGERGGEDRGGAGDRTERRRRE